VVSFTPLALFPGENSDRFQLNAWMGGPQGNSGRRAGADSSFPLPQIVPRFVGRPAHSRVLNTAELFNLLV
jgi:hypothetical protein